MVHFPIALKYRPAPFTHPVWISTPDAKVPRMELDMTVTFQQTWEAMEGLVREGLVKNIGVSNVSCGKLIDIMKYAKIKPAIVQNELHPHFTNEHLVKFARQNGI